MTPSLEVSSRRVRVAAEILWRALVVVAGLHAYWLLGGTWAVHAASGGAYSDVTTGLRVQSALMVLLLIVASLMVRARAGLGRAPVSDRTVHVATWALTAVLGLASLVNFTASTNVERLVIGPFVLVLAVLAFVVASDGVRQLPHRRHALPAGNRDVPRGVVR